MQPKNWRRKDLTRESHKNCRQRSEKKEPEKRSLTKTAAKKLEKNLTRESHKNCRQRLEKKEPDKRISQKMQQKIGKERISQKKITKIN